MRFLLSGVLLTAFWAAAADATPEKAADLPSLCRMAETNRDWSSAWGFAEKWASSSDPATRRAGVAKLLDLALHRENVDFDKLTRTARDAGLSEAELALWQIRVDLTANRYEAAEKQLEPLIAAGKLSREQLSHALRLQTFALLGLKRYPDAVQSSERRLTVAPTTAERFDAACYLAYALTLGDRNDSAQELVTKIAADYPQYSGELADLQLLLAVRRGNWDDFQKQFNEKAPVEHSRRRSGWYFSACREAAALAEKNGDRAMAVRLRREALRTADFERDRRQAMLELLSTFDRFGMWKDISEAINLYLEWYPNAPDRIDLELQAARHLVKAGDIRSALKIYDGILGEKSADAPGCDRSAVALEAARQCGAANLADEERVYLQHALRHAGTPEARQDAFFLLGEHHGRAGADQAALDAFRMAASTQGPRSEEARFRQMIILLKNKDYRSAQQIAETLRKASSPDIRASAQYHLAALHEKLGRPAQAATEYQAFAKEFPQSKLAPAALYNAALIAESIDDPEETVRRFEAFLKHSPKHRLASNALYKLFLAQIRAGHPADARAAGERLAAEFPESPFAAAALFSLADRAEEEKHFTDALEYLNRIEKMPIRLSGTQARVLFDRAGIHAKLDDPRKALELLDKLLAAYASDPVAADAAELAGVLHSRLGDYTAGAAAYYRAAQLRPGGAFAAACLEHRADCIFLLASAAENVEQLRLAEQEYRALYRKGLRPWTPLLFKTGRCLEALNEPVEARRVYAELLYRAAAERRKGVRPSQPWCSKALYAAIRLDCARRSLDGARNALRLVRLAREAGLEQNGELESVERELRSKYKL